ncbi:MAG: hypothetical protein K2X82_28845 [Gemmataceae bacterium]|nr:hypothetical protein [Gemmataceae bacterium]
MRPIVLLLAAGVVGSTGCSAFVASSGTELAKLKTRDEVRGKFGEPVGQGTEEGEFYEDYRTRRKIAEQWKGIYSCMGFAYTLGLSELYAFPHEVFVAARRSLAGQTVRVEYDGAGEVAGVRLIDGGGPTGWRRPTPAAAPSPGPPPSP